MSHPETALQEEASPQSDNHHGADAGAALPPLVGLAGERTLRSHAAEGVLREGPTALALLRRDALLRRPLAAADLFAGAVALFLAGSLAGPRPVPLAALLMLPLLVLTAQIIGLYHRDEHLLRRTTLEEAPGVFQVATLHALLTWLAVDIAATTRLEARQVVVLWLLLFVLMLLGRTVARRAVRQITPVERCLVVGDAHTAAVLRRKFDVSFSLKATVVGRMPLAGEAAADGRNGGSVVPVVGTLENLDEILITNAIHRVIIVPSGSDDSLEAIRVVKALGVKLSVLPRMLEVAGSSFEFDDVDGVTFLGVRRSELTRSSRLLKRGMDVMAAATGLVLLAPLIAAIALAIKLNSPGPVLYRQKRIGRHGREFQIMKFRSMVDGADAQKAALLDLNETEGLFKIANDPRVTAVGRVLRKSSLDELPQLWNVLRGEMSLVGPRPLVPDDDVKIEGWQRTRLNVTPGMTGAWQILGSTRVPLEEMVKLDYLYGATWSLWLDIKILLRTVAYVASRRSA